MGLITCPDCGREVSDRADKCPNCARPLNQDIPASSETVKSGTQRASASYDIGGGVGLAGFVGAILVGYMVGSFWVGIVLAIVALTAGVWLHRAHTYGVWSSRTWPSVLGLERLFGKKRVPLRVLVLILVWIYAPSLHGQSSARSPACDRCDLRLDYVVTLGSAEDSVGIISGATVRQDRRGHYYAFAQDIGPQIIVYDTQGVFSHVIGRTGRGPGELATVHTVAVSPLDTLYVVDVGEIEVFTPAGLHVRSFRIPGIFLQVVALSNGDLLATGSLLAIPAASSNTGYPLHLLRSDSIITSFGFRGGGTSSLSAVPAIASGVRREAPILVSPRDAYRVAGYDLDGEEQWVFERRLEWLTTDVTRSSSAPAVPTPRFVSIHQDESGLVWTILRRPSTDRAGREPFLTLPSPNDLDRRFDMIIEVFDPITGRMMGTGTFDEYFVGFLPGRKVYRARELESGAIVIEVYKMAMR